MLAGKSVEQYAHRLFHNPLLIDHSQPFNDVLAQSNYAINRSADPIVNALVNANELIAETDILFPLEDELDLYEVKSCTTAKPEHIPDIAFQKYVAEKRGLRIRRCFLILLNNKYVRKGDINPKQLFSIGDVTEGVSNYDELNDVESQVNNAVLIAHQKQCPETKIGLQCHDDCPMRSKCWKRVDAVENNIFNLYRIQRKKAFEWYEQGIIESSDIPKEYPLISRQKVQVKAESNGQLKVNKKAITNFLNQLTYPLFFLDFETFSSPIPLIDGTFPYQQLPFQYSLHVIEKDLSKTPKHFSWIWNVDNEKDPREFLLRHLQSRLGKSGSILAYNAVFELMVLNKSAEAFPVYKEWLEGIIKRFVDLLMPFRQFHIYHPKQKGSCSLKSVLPALTGKDYSSLEIQDGGQASEAFMGILAGDVKGQQKEVILKHLEAYCGQDTMAMVEIVRKMKLFSP